MKQIAVILFSCVLLANALEEEKRVVYGNDDRTEAYSITDPNLLKLIQADVGLFAQSKFSQNSDGNWSLINYDVYNHGGILGWGSCNLCSDEPFQGQIVAGFCSGFLVNRNQIITSGYCLNGKSAADIYVLFDFSQQSAGVGPNITNIPNNNLYKAASLNYVFNSTQDWGVITLDRDVVGRTPLNCRESGDVEVGAPLVLVGHPMGIPMKVAANAEVKSNASGSNFFAANTDSFAGNAGSMVVNTDTWVVEGILASGELDFVMDSSNGCCRSKVCSDDTGCSRWFESVTKITIAGFNRDQPSGTTTDNSGSTTDSGSGTTGSTTTGSGATTDNSGTTEDSHSGNAAVIKPAMLMLPLLVLTLV